ncbi:MAG: ChaN family lipoprotein [Armatimonadetes bacterium]|nr:ChaN family lipoprotein [Armatimonadota bacterium]
MIALLAAAVLQDDPYTLDIGAPGTVEVRSGYTRTATGQAATPDDIAAAADGLQYVFVGESHDQLAHHLAQTAIIDALLKRGRDVIVGFEMFTRDNQRNLAPWSVGYWSQDQFIEKSGWETQWGFDYKLYAPIFDAIRIHRLPMVALNVPREWVRSVGREGPGALNSEQREWVPDLFLEDETHRAIFASMMGGHPVTGTQGENIYAAMVTWDEGMARSAIDYMDTRHNRNAVMVVVAGSGHMMYDRGINYRIKLRSGAESLNITCITASETRSVSRGLADFVFVSEAE